MVASWALLAALAAVVLPGTAGFRVLGVFPYNGRSHNLMFQAAMEILADRGHEVVMLSPFPQRRPRANYTDLDLSKELPSLVNTRTYEQMTNPGHSHVAVIAAVAGADLCRAVFATQYFRDVMAGVHGSFDVVFTEIFGSDCWAAVAYKMDVPLISIVSAPDYAWMHERVGSVDNPAYLVANNGPFVGRLSLLQRLQNTIAYLVANLQHKYYVQWPSDAVVREVFGADTPPISELVLRTSLVMVNAHVAVNPARPIAPNVIHVAGVHLKDAIVRPEDTVGGQGGRTDSKGLSRDLRRWMDEAEDGVIVFTLGSLVRSSSMPEHTIRSLIQAFAALPRHRVLWKYEADDIAPLLPDNVRTATWLPQLDVLAHPKTVLFITHGGLMGSSEAILLGVPMLGIPLFSDQIPNVELYRALGIAERLGHADITRDSVLAVVNKLTRTDKYRVRAKQIAARYLDRPMSAAASVLWWTEYVVRHGGARHLRPLGADMPLYQYLLLDVVAVLLAAVVGVLVLLRALIRAILARLPPPARTIASAKRDKQQ